MGTDPKAAPSSETTAQTIQAFVQNYPELMQAENAGAVPAAQAQLEAAQATSPGLTALQDQLYKQYGLSMGQTSDQVAAQQAMDQAKSDTNVMAGPGAGLVTANEALQQQENPEFYAARSQMDNQLGNLFSSINLGGQVTPGENEQMSRALAQQNNQRGIANNPSSTAALSNALTFGSAQTAREQQAKTNLTNVLNVGNSFLPASKTGTDTFQIATGRSSTPNAGASQFQGVNTGLAANAASSGSNLLGQIGNLQQQQASITANRRDSIDRAAEVTGGING